MDEDERLHAQLFGDLDDSDDDDAAAPPAAPAETDDRIAEIVAANADAAAAAPKRKKKADAAEPKKRLKNFHVNLNNMELRDPSNEQLSNLKGELHNSAKSAQSAASIEHVEGKAMQRLERKQMHKKQLGKTKRSPRKESLSNRRTSKPEDINASAAEIETKLSPKQSS